LARSGDVGQLWCDGARRGPVGQGVVRHDMAVMVRQVLIRRGSVGLGTAVKVRFAVFRPVMACSGKVRYGSYGKLSQGTLRYGEVRSGRHINLHEY